MLRTLDLFSGIGLFSVGLHETGGFTTVAALSLAQELIKEGDLLAASFKRKGRQFDKVFKSGRTHLQDATPVRLGQEFKGFAGQAEYSVQRLHRAQEALAEVALGGTAVGTGVNTHEEFSARTCKTVSDACGVFIKETASHFQAQSTTWSGSAREANAWASS